MTSKIGSASLPSVPESFQQGEKFIKWDDENGPGVPVTLRIDKNGFFLYWIDQHKDMESLDIATIKDSRTGKLAKIPKESKLRQVVCMGSQDEPLEDKTITIALGQDFVNLSFINFCSNSKETAQTWTEVILRLAYSPAQLNYSLQTTLTKLYTRISLAQDKQGNIPVKNVVKPFAQNKEDRKKVKTALEMTGFPSGKDDVITSEKFTFEDFFIFYKNLTQRGDIEKIFDEFCEGKKGGMSVTQVVEFLNKCQRDPRLNEILHPYADEARASSLIKQYETDEQLVESNKLSLNGFIRYLVGEESLVVFPTKQDMDQPMSCYFINSSHNTYLTGHQLTGKSSVEMYRQCLLTGCRCVELDLWNGSGKSEEPTVVHGYTLVPDLQAKDVIQTIAQSAFVTSDYPVILSFENHCNPRQQAKIANYCREFFGDTLLDKPLDSYPLDSGIPLPPPSQLKRKIIIKNKKRNPVLERSPGEARAATGDAETDVGDPPPTPIETTNGFALKEEIEKVQGVSKGTKEVTEVDSSIDVTSLKEEVKEVLEEVVKKEEKPVNRELTEAISIESTKEDVLKEQEDAPKVESKEQEEESKTKAETEAGAEISALVNYVQPVHFSSFDESEKKDKSFEMSSFDEKQATSLLKESPIEFVNYNKRQLARVYPAGTRFDSSNFMPQVFWNAGCQLVALNYQTLDLAMQLNLGIFEYNCRSGYLLKPEFMRRTDRRFDPFAESTVDGIIAGTVVVHVISGQLLTDKRCGTYVEVDMFGLPADTVRKKFKTKVIPNNAINPVYDDEPFVFKKVVLPELACLRISAYEENGKFIGHRVLPLQVLCPGYRHVGLRSESGQPLGAATLFLHIIVKDYVPDGLTELAEALANPIKYQSELDRREKQLAVLTEGMDILEDKEDEVGSMKSPAERTILKREISRVSCERGTSVTASVEAEGIEVTVAGLEAFMEAEGAITAAQLHADRQPIPQQTKYEITHISDLAQPMQADTLDKFLNSKAVTEKKMELEKKLEALRKKQEKEKERAEDPEKSTTNCLPNINRLSSNKTVSGAEELARMHLAQEQGLKEKYHSMVYTILSKAITSRQAAQLKELSSALERETAAVMRRLQAQRSKELRRLSKQHRHKDELNRMKREVGSAMVARGVEERVRLRVLYERQREQLEQQHANVRSLLEQECNKAKAALQREFEERLPKEEDVAKKDEDQVTTASPVVNNHSG